MALTTCRLKKVNSAGSFITTRKLMNSNDVKKETVIVTSMTKNTIAPRRKSSTSTAPSPRPTESPRKDSTLTTPRKDSARGLRKESITKIITTVGISEHSELLGDQVKYDSVPKLRLRRKELEESTVKVDQQIEKMLWMKSTLQKLSTMMEQFSTSIFQLSRNNQGVPYIANVKALIETIYSDFNSSLIQKDIIRMNEENIPFIRDLNIQFENIHKLCETIIVTHTNYHVTYVEDFHMVTGKVRGMLKTIIQMFYDDELGGDDETNAVYVEEDEQEEEAESGEDTNSSDNKEDEEKPQQDEKCIPKILLGDLDGKIEGNKQIVEELQKIRMIFCTLNDKLGEIERLSLGNPRTQSLCDTFSNIQEILVGTINLCAHYEENGVPCIAHIKNIITKMNKLSSVKRPLEKHVEQMKLLLGDCDGRILIVAKCLSMTP